MQRWHATRLIYRGVNIFEHNAVSDEPRTTNQLITPAGGKEEEEERHIVVMFFIFTALGLNP